MLRVITPSADEPVSLAEAKGHIGLTHSADDTLISGFITAAREVAERQTGYALAVADYEWWPVGERREPLPIWPGTVTSEEGAYPILFTTAPGVAPGALKAAILLMTADLYVNREAGGEALAENPTVQRLLFPYRRVLP